MSSLLDTIKKASLAAAEATGPLAVMYGEIVTVDPLSVKVDQRFTLTSGFLVVPESLVRYEADLKHKHQYAGSDTSEALTGKLVIRYGLQEGDKVILLRVQGGQQYIILDKVVSE